MLLAVAVLKVTPPDPPAKVYDPPLPALLGIALILPTSGILMPPLPFAVMLIEPAAPLVVPPLQLIEPATPLLLALGSTVKAATLLLEMVTDPPAPAPLPLAVRL